jgi:hypothetical protein
MMDSIVNRVLDYIRTQRAVSFDEVCDYMVAQRLRFGSAANPIEYLDLVARSTGAIDVDYDERMIYGCLPVGAFAADDTLSRVG